jgi:hypothetical protein
MTVYRFDSSDRKVDGKGCDRYEQRTPAAVACRSAAEIGGESESGYTRARASCPLREHDHEHKLETARP